jgi:transaldolase
MSSRAERLLELGQSVWLDFIRRGHLVSGEFDRLVREEGVVGVTSNPTIFQMAIAESGDYDEALGQRVRQGLEGPALFESLAVEDIQMACDHLLGVWERTGGRDGRVSIEVSPRLAHQTTASIEEGRRLHRAVSRPNLMVKVPATPEGLPAITTLVADGICVNVTLIFSLARYAQVMDAWLSGLERRAAQGEPVTGVFSVASFFVSRVDNKVDAAIEKARAALPATDRSRAELESFKGRAAIANARLAYAAFREMAASPRWAPLRARGAPVQRPLWASTSTKNPAYPDTLYVDELIGADTVNTMPPQTLAAYNDHGKTEVSIERDLDGARALFARLPALGVPIDALIDQLEPEGVAAFAKSYDTLLAALETRRREVAATRGA